MLIEFVDIVDIGMLRVETTAEHVSNNGTAITLALLPVDFPVWSVSRLLLFIPYNIFS